MGVWNLDHKKLDIYLVGMMDRFLGVYYPIILFFPRKGGYPLGMQSLLNEF